MKSAITPYKIGDRFEFLGCGPHQITAVIAKGDTFEYVAEYKGDPFMKYWKCSTYGHGSIDIINTLED